MAEIDPVKYAELVEEARGLRAMNEQLWEKLVDVKMRLVDLEDEIDLLIERQP